MPNVVSFTPPWLSRPSPGSSFFSGQSSDQVPSKASQGPSGKDTDTARYEAEYEGPTRIIARRGTEIFTVVDNQIRWANLVTLRDEWRSQESENRKSSKQTKEGKKESSAPAAAVEEPSEDGSHHYRVGDRDWISPGHRSQFIRYLVFPYTALSDS